MLEKHRQLIELFNENQVEGIDIVNELLRFRALDQIVSANAKAREWGLTSEELYKLGETSTVESFGPIPYDESKLQKLYGPSFSVELMDFLSDTDFVDGIDAGHQWELPIREAIKEQCDTDHLVLFAYVEEYACMVDEILQSFKDKKVVLYTASPVCYSMLSRLYPEAQIIDHWPNKSYFDHIVTATVGMFQSTEDIVEEVANGLNNLVTEGTAKLFLPATMVQAQVGMNKMALQFLLNQDRIEMIREWVPLGAYEFVYNAYPIKKTRIALKEIIGDTVKETPFIQLPHGVFADMPVFSVLNYALSLRSILLPGGQTDPTLGQDGIYCMDSRVPSHVKANLEEVGAYYLSFTSGESDSINCSLSTTAPVDGVYWIFPDEELAMLWYTYFSSTIGQKIMGNIKALVNTFESLGYMLSSCRRSVLSIEREETLVQAVTTSRNAYAAVLEEAEATWQSTVDELATEVIPKSISIDLDDYTE